MTGSNHGYRVYHICPYGQGGISTVADSILNSSLHTSYNLKRYNTTFYRFRIIPYAVTVLRCMKMQNTQNEIVHIHVASKGSFFRKFIIGRICKKKRIPYIVHIHGAKFREFYSDADSKTRTKICRFFYDAERIIVLTKDWLPFIQDLGFADKTVIIPNFTAVPEYRRADPEKGTVHLLFLGRIGQRKGVYDLIRAMDLVINKHKFNRIRLVIAGDGGRKKASRMVEEYGIRDYVTVRGWVSGPRKDKLLRLSDIMVLPSYFESFGLSLIEGMSYGIPVISSTAGSIPAVVRNGADGILVAPGNIDELAKAIITLAADEKMRREMGENGRKRVVENYSEERVCSMIDRLYLSVFRNMAKPEDGG